ncbi:MAG TPA: CoA ester lyase [Polyangiaceae bacterium LLY-WYZ-15_(1-7)]|nr:CoA ester lyase [Sandaracinus sp.]HJK90864.1 CoA ester lyase [Polyangiaceae bacterium LLY-WYZ-15_(1-7)]HJL06307.1 CoA ester lyase [Polyangiaceae bacterium LLY-WYZ-15_(1-7)]HJL10798.1 CoA ester lyase [Polyangiaceae bacterium LLY-WYZ-15_(1-7)]HJL21406.1 CoA ester lyase [Polyangiaceae bacterium LLY-WYZ-15_(1-7)]
MKTTSRPRRSVLYMPGSNTRALEKGQTLPCDGIILDLEDAVTPDAKDAARGHVVEALKTNDYGPRELLLRVNGLDTPWGYADLAAAATSGAHAALLPKVESADDVRKAARILEAHGAPDELALWCMMETPRGILRAEEIADAHPRLAGFVMGTSDLAKDLHAAHTPMRLPLLVGLGTCLLAARAAGLAILDGVYLDLGDAEGFAASCKQGAELGFDGKTLIHPKQLEAANEVFAPSAEAVEFSRRIIAAHAEAQKEGKGVVVVDGKLIENLHVENAQRLVALADAIAARA